MRLLLQTSIDSDDIKNFAVSNDRDTMVCGRTSRGPSEGLRYTSAEIFAGGGDTRLSTHSGVALEITEQKLSGMSLTISAN